MTNNSTVYWDIQRANGTWMSLHTYAYSVKSFGGRRWVAGAKRGENLMIPHRRGRIYTPKTRESQTFDLNFWLFPIEEDGRKPLTKTVEQKTHENWRKLISAFDQEGEFKIRKRWHLDSSHKNTFGTSTQVASAIGTAEFVDASGPDSDDGRGFYGNITLSLADPYFYSNVIVDDYTAFAKSLGATELTWPSATFTTLGEAPTDHLWLSFSGGTGTNPRVTFPDGNWVQLLTSEMAFPGVEVIVDCSTGVAVQSQFAEYLAGIPTSNLYLNGIVRRNPYFNNWPTLDPNKYLSSTINRTGDSTIKLVYDPAYR